MSNKQILDYIENDMTAFQNRSIAPFTCVQTAGDVIIIPENWGHGVLNIQESIAVASEARYGIWRVKPTSPVYNQFPGFVNAAFARPHRPEDGLQRNMNSNRNGRAGPIMSIK
jgi:hypothetical protein